MPIIAADQISGPVVATNKLVEVAVGLIIRDNQCLLAKRPKHVHQGGLWEFPGGKIDAGEAVDAALHRELNEELGISVIASHPLFTIEHQYPDKSVKLHIWRVSEFDGQACGREGQLVRWFAFDELAGLEFPEANREILEYVASLEENDS